jgi:hypothetical protein
MRAIQHPTSSNVLTPPADRPDVRPIPVTRARYNGRAGVVSVWQPSDADKLAIATGNPIIAFLEVGDYVPPHALAVLGADGLQLERTPT